MAENQPSSEAAPSADVIKERVADLDEQTDLGAGNKEPDPATAEDPPSDVRAGDKKRTQT
ncbi:MAG: hypothetical protein ACRDTA_09835 [Pseudonocardiaceae bacterium]